MEGDKLNHVKELKSGGMSWEHILERLRENGLGEEEANQIIAIARSEIRSKNKNIGMLLLGVGSFICFFSMIFTYLFGHDYFMLYGLTMIGVSVAFAGLVYVMG